MKHYAISFFLLAIVALAQLPTGCGKASHYSKYDDRLVTADSLMPDSAARALSLLSQLDKEEFSHKADRAYYALLITQARYHCYQRATTDSIINIALDYYMRHEDETEKLTRVLTYKGAVMEELGQEDNAMQYYKKALTIVSPDDHFNIGYIKLRIGNIYRDNMIADSSDVTLFKEALHHFEQAGDSMYMLTCLSEIGSSYIKTNRDSLNEYLDRANTLSQKLNNRAVRQDNQIYIADIKMFSHNPQDVASAKEVALSLLHDSDCPDYHKDHLLLMAAITLAKLNDTDSARLFLKQVSRDSLSSGLNVLYEKCLAELSLSQDDIRQYQQHYEKSEDIADSIANNDRQKVLREIAERYDNETLKYENLRIKSIIAVSILVGLCLICALTIALMAVSRRGARRMRQLQDNEVTIMQLNRDKASLTAQLDANKMMSDSMKLTIKQQTETFLHLVKSHVTDFADNPKQFSQLFKKSYSIRLPDNSFWTSLRAYADSQFCNIITKARDSSPLLSEKDLNFLSLYCCDLPTTVIMACMGYTDPHSVYNKKRRIASALELEETLDDYIERFRRR